MLPTAVKDELAELLSFFIYTRQKTDDTGKRQQFNLRRTARDETSQIYVTVLAYLQRKKKKLASVRFLT
jgi:hypothetical protein